VLTTGGVIGDFSSLVGLSEEDTASVEASVRDVISNVDIDAAKEAIDDITAKYAAEAAKQLTAEGALPTTDTAVDRLRQTPQYVEAANSASMKSFMSQDTLSFVQDSTQLSSIPSATPDTVVQIIAQVFHGVSRADTAALMKVWMNAATERAVNKKMQTVDINKLEDSLRNTQDLSARLAQLTEDRANVAQGDPKISQLDEQIEAAKSGLAESEDKDRQMQEDAKEAQDAKGNQDRRQSDFEEMEKEERERLREIQNGGEETQGGRGELRMHQGI
jgi:hypothetical protein